MSKLITVKILLAGIIVGTLDITAAMLQFFIKTGKDPLIVLKFVASGVFGTDAMKGGGDMIAWGFLFHYLIAMSFTVFFFWLCSKMPLLLQHRLATGIAYGIFAWAFMRFIVLPLSLTNQQPFNLNAALIAASIIVVCIGLPLAFMAASFRRQTT